MIAIPLSWKIAIGATLMTIALAAMWWAFSEGKDAAHADNLENDHRNSTEHHRCGRSWPSHS